MIVAGLVQGRSEEVAVSLQVGGPEPTNLKGFSFWMLCLEEGVLKSILGFGLVMVAVCPVCLHDGMIYLC